MSTLNKNDYIYHKERCYNLYGIQYVFTCIEKISQWKKKPIYKML